MDPFLIFGMLCTLGFAYGIAMSVVRLCNEAAEILSGRAGHGVRP